MMSKHMNSMSGSVGPDEGITAKVCDFGLVSLSYRTTVSHHFGKLWRYYIHTRIIKSTKLTSPFMFTIRLLTCSTNNMAMSKIVSICANKMEVGIYHECD